MEKLPKLYYVFILPVLIIALTGCELSRNSNETSDLEPVSELSPTLAPLGSEETLTGEATAIPTVINVQPTATESSLEGGQAADDPNELMAPTTQPVDLGASPEAAGGSEAQGAAVIESETFTPPEEQAGATAEEPVIVDAPIEQLPDGGPIAANPPASETGDYGTTGYGDAAYTVQPGDTLFSIGVRYGVSAQSIMYANGLTSDIIQVGQTLAIPAGDDAGYAPPAYDPGDTPPAYDPGYSGGNGYGNEHVVAPGDTLYRIALQYGLSVDAIAGANGIPYPYLIQVGQPLLIPASDAYPGPPPPPEGGYYQPNDGYYPAPDNSYPAPGGGNTHTVAPGETLFFIAQRYGLTANAIAQANGLVNPNQIFVGQVLYLP